MFKRKLTYFLTAVIVIAMLPILALAAEFSDMPNNWSTAALQNAVSNGLIHGFNGKIMPNANLTRAEMATIVNHAFKATEKDSLSGYNDVPTSSWYYDEMAKAVHMGTFIGYGNKLDPLSSITRQEAFMVLAKAFKLPDGNTAALNGFKDINSVSSWAVGAISALKSAGYLSGANGKINPQANITRAEFAQMMYNMIKGYFTAEGTYTSVPSGNIMINVPNVTLKGVTITGDLIIGDGVGASDVSVTAKNAGIGSAVIEGENAQFIVASGSTVNTLNVDAPNTSIEVAGSITNIVINGEGAEVSGSCNVENVAANANNVTVTTPGTQVTAGRYTYN